MIDEHVAIFENEERQVLTLGQGPIIAFFTTEDFYSFVISTSKQPVKTMMKLALLLLLGAVSIFAQNCLIVVPPNPLTATGLATPYRLQGCNQSNVGMAAFVEGSILDTNTGKLFVYNPLVITDGTTPLVTPTAPNILPSMIVALWFGFNGATLTLVDNGGSLASGTIGKILL